MDVYRKYADSGWIDGKKYRIFHGRYHNALGPTRKNFVDSDMVTSLTYAYYIH